MRCIACDNIIHQLRINKKSGQLEDMCDRCLALAFNPDLVTGDDVIDASTTVEVLNDMDEPWDNT